MRPQQVNLFIHAILTLLDRPVFSGGKLVLLGSPWRPFRFLVTDDPKRIARRSGHETGPTQRLIKHLTYRNELSSVSAALHASRERTLRSQPFGLGKTDQKA
jgi:hypothetical protein